MGEVVATALSRDHELAKRTVSSINLVVGLGVEGDCHAGKDVQHRSRKHIKPALPNLRQVHFTDQSILDINDLAPGEIGENITTSGVDLLSLSEGARLHFMGSGPTTDDDVAGNRQIHPNVVVTGLRNPCSQIEKHRKGLQEKFIVRDEHRKIVGRQAGVMAVVEIGGTIMPGMRIIVEAPQIYKPLICV